MAAPRTSAGGPVRKGAAASPSTEAVAQLRRILQYELSKGCDDSAVIGGLDRFLERARQDAGAARIIAAAPKLARGYKGLPLSGRRDWIRLVMGLEPGARKAPAKPVAAAPKPQAPRPAAVTPSSDPLDWPVTVVKGVREALARALAKMGVATVRDLLYLFPNRHNDFADVRTIAELKVGEEQTCARQRLEAPARAPGPHVRHAGDGGRRDRHDARRLVQPALPGGAAQGQRPHRAVRQGGLFNGLKTMEHPSGSASRATT